MEIALFVAGLWAMLLAIAAFLVLVVAPLEAVAGGVPRMVISVIQAIVAIAAVVLFVFALGLLKRAYLSRKLAT